MMGRTPFGVKLLDGQEGDYVLSLLKFNPIVQTMAGRVRSSRRPKKTLHTTQVNSRTLTYPTLSIPSLSTSPSQAATSKTGSTSPAGTASRKVVCEWRPYTLYFHDVADDLTDHLTVPLRKHTPVPVPRVHWPRRVAPHLRYIHARASGHGTG
jgi:hypothetical protein